ncbi:MAG TPA: hypothetical protein VGG33_03885, partial [Polyangia bacterium]
WWPVGLLLALLGILVLVSGLRALGVDGWLAFILATALLGLAPLVWHLLAERQRRLGSSLGVADRFAVRAGTVSLLALVATLANVGPRTAGERVYALVKSWSTPKPAEKPKEPALLPVTPKTPARHELESFIPADAGLVVALSGPAMLGHLLTQQSGQVKNGLEALGKCQIGVDRARVLIAAKNHDTRMIVVRAPGITDQRNLYCVVGILGSGNVALRITNERSPLRFEVTGLMARPMKFEGVDGETVVMVDEGWAASANKKLFVGADSAQGPLGPIIGKADRGASLWSAALGQTETGPVDLIFEASPRDSLLHMHASAANPAGTEPRAEFTARVPVGFVNALPAAALTQGIGGLLKIASALAGGLPAAASSETP